jgi:hypothetical protein
MVFDGGDGAGQGAHLALANAFDECLDVMIGVHDWLLRQLKIAASAAPVNVHPILSSREGL